MTFNVSGMAMMCERSTQGLPLYTPLCNLIHEIEGCVRACKMELLHKSSDEESYHGIFMVKVDFLAIVQVQSLAVSDDLHDGVGFV